MSKKTDFELNLSAKQAVADVLKDLGIIDETADKVINKKRDIKVDVDVSAAKKQLENLTSNLNKTYTEMAKIYQKYLKTTSDKQKRNYSNNLETLNGRLLAQGKGKISQDDILSGVAKSLKEIGVEGIKTKNILQTITDATSRKKSSGNLIDYVKELQQLGASSDSLDGLIDKHKELKRTIESVETRLNSKDLKAKLEKTFENSASGSQKTMLDFIQAFKDYVIAGNKVKDINSEIVENYNYLADEDYSKKIKEAFVPIEQIETLEQLKNKEKSLIEEISNIVPMSSKVRNDFFNEISSGMKKQQKLAKSTADIFANTEKENFDNVVEAATPTIETLSKVQEQIQETAQSSFHLDIAKAKLQEFYEVYSNGDISDEEFVGYVQDFEKMGFKFSEDMKDIEEDYKYFSKYLSEMDIPKLSLLEDDPSGYTETNIKSVTEAIKEETKVVKELHAEQSNETSVSLENKNLEELIQLYHQLGTSNDTTEKLQSISKAILEIVQSEKQLDAGEMQKFAEILKGLTFVDGDSPILKKPYTINEAIDALNKLKCVQSSTTTLFQEESGQLSFIEGVDQAVHSQEKLQDEIKQTNDVIEGQITLEEYLTKIQTQQSGVSNQDNIKQAIKANQEFAEIAEKSENAAKEEGQASEQAAEKFKELATAKEKASQANKKFADTAEITSNVAIEASNSIEKIKDSSNEIIASLERVENVEGEVINDTKELTNSFKKFQDQAKQSGSYNFDDMAKAFQSFYANQGLEYKNASVTIDGSTWELITAQVTYYDDALKQTVTDTYTLDETTKELTRSIINLKDNGLARAKATEAQIKAEEKAINANKKLEADKKFQETKISKITEELKELGLLTNETEEKLKEFSDSLSKVSSSSELSSWVAEFRNVNNEIENTIKTVKQSQSKDFKINSWNQQISDFKNLDQQTDAYKNNLNSLIQKVKEYKKLDIFGQDKEKAKELSSEINKLINDLNRGTGKNGKYAEINSKGKISDYHNIDEARAAYEKLGYTITNVNDKTKEFTAQTKNANGDLKTVKVTIGQTEEELRELSNTIYKGSTSLNVFQYGFNSLKNTLSQFVHVYLSFSDIFRYIRTGFDQVNEIDTALSEMRKVSEEPLNVLKEFQAESYDLANSVGVTGLALQQSTADWMRIGDSIKEAKEHAKDANILMQVSEFDNIEDATTSLIAMNQAWKDIDTGHIIDVVNIIGNKFSISTDELAESLQRSAGTLATLGATLEEVSALTVAGNAILQDPSRVARGKLLPQYTVMYRHTIVC